MKRTLILVALSSILSVAAWTQSLPDSTARQHRQQRGFVDENGDGVRDRGRQQQKRVRQRTDRFIDTNGDGISDGRECGFGFRRETGSGNGAGKQTGKKGQGKK